jgi:hypothetical protein
VTQSDSAAAAAREAAPDDTGLGGSRGSLGVTWAELRVALWLSLTCAVTAALVAVPASVVYLFGQDLGSACRWARAWTESLPSAIRRGCNAASRTPWSSTGAQRRPDGGSSFRVRGHRQLCCSACQSVRRLPRRISQSVQTQQRGSSPARSSEQPAENDKYLAPTTLRCLVDDPTRQPALFFALYGLTPDMRYGTRTTRIA